VSLRRQIGVFVDKGASLEGINSIPKDASKSSEITAPHGSRAIYLYLCANDRADRATISMRLNKIR